MKKVLTVLSSLALVSAASAQVTILLESFGDPSTTAAVDTYNGYDNSTLTFSGTGEIRNSSPSTNYTGASGGGNVLINTTNEFFEIGGLSTIGYSNVFLVFGSYEEIANQSGVDASVLTVEYSDSNSGWIPLDYVGPGANGWGIAASATGVIPESSSLSLRFTNIYSASRTIRLDDIQLIGDASTSVVPEPSMISLLLGALAMVGLVRRRR